MKNHLALSVLALSAALCTYASASEVTDRLQPGAVAAAQQRGASELGCPTATAKVIGQKPIEEPQTTGWYEPPHGAEYTVAVSGCSKSTTYLVACDEWQKKGCKASPVTAPRPPPQALADAMRPNAITAAQQRGSTELGCPAAAAKVVREETIEEPATTGWYEPAHRAAYRVDVSGCEKRKTYLVACDAERKQCAAGAFQEPSKSGPRQPALAEELQPGALKAAQAQGASELGCAAATARVLRQETIEEPQTTGWYEPAHRALYTAEVSGCGKSKAYLVGCDKLKRACRVAKTVQEASRE